MGSTLLRIKPVKVTMIRNKREEKELEHQVKRDFPEKKKF